MARSINLLKKLSAVEYQHSAQFMGQYYFDEEETEAGNGAKSAYLSEVQNRVLLEPV